MNPLKPFTAQQQVLNYEGKSHYSIQKAQDIIKTNLVVFIILVGG